MSLRSRLMTSSFARTPSNAPLQGAGQGVVTVGRFRAASMAALRLSLPLALCLGLPGCGSGNPVGPPPMTPPPIVSFAGSYSGSYTITACGNTQDFQTIQFCNSTGFVVGETLPMSLTLTQTGSSVTGTLSQHDLSTPVTGTVGGDGHLTLSGTTDVAGFTVAIAEWNTQLAGSTVSGTFVDHFTSPGILQGFAQFQGSIDMVATTAAIHPSLLSQGRGGTSGTLRDLVDAMK